MSRRYVMGDIHGQYDKLQACLESVNFDYETDVLIQLGDVVDRGIDTYSCVELLSTIKNLIAIRGNHDDEWFRYLKTGVQSNLWTQGARETYQSYSILHIDPKVHLNFFTNQKPYYVDKDNNLFIHGGFNRHYNIEDQSDIQWYWDRDLWLGALSWQAMKDKSYPYKIKQKFKEIFIGHTPTNYWGSTIPMKAANIWNIDTGSGKLGYLTIMNIDTKEYKQF